MMTAPDLLDPRRSAHASINGYNYQMCLSVLRWLQLARNEVIVFEGNEDIDRFRECAIREGNFAIYEQVKHLSGAVGIGDKAVSKTLTNFLTSYVALRQQDDATRFVFVFTTTSRFRPRMSASDVDVLADWHDQEKRAAVIEELRNQLLSGHVSRKRPHRQKVPSKVPDLPAAIEWLDEPPGRWDGFFSAVELHPGAPDLQGTLQQINDHFSSRSNTRDLADDLTSRLIWEAYSTASRT